MALYFLVDFPKTIFQILFCVDSKSVLECLKNLNTKSRPDLIVEISHLIHLLIIRGSDITFMWVPSHCGIFYNDKVDRAAKLGAQHSLNSQKLNVCLSYHEINTVMKRKAKDELQLKIINMNKNGEQHWFPIKENSRNHLWIERNLTTCFDISCQLSYKTCYTY